MTIVYAVETGDYSSYQVLALFANRSDAEIVARRVGGEVVARTVYDVEPAPIPYYIIENLDELRGGSKPEMRTQLIEAWDGPYWKGRMVRGVASSEWRSEYQGGVRAIRVWGTDKEGVRRRWQEMTQVQEAEKSGL